MKTKKQTRNVRINVLHVWRFFLALTLIFGTTLIYWLSQTSSREWILPSRGETKTPRTRATPPSFSLYARGTENTGRAAMTRGRERGCVGGLGRRRPSAKIVAAAAIYFVVFVAALVAVDAAETPAAPSPKPQPPPAPPSQNGASRGNRSVTVMDAASFRAALEDDNVSEILIGGGGSSSAPPPLSASSLATSTSASLYSSSLGGDIDLDLDPAWPRDGPPVVVSPGRTLVLRSADRSNPSSLNFSGGPTPAIVVSKNATLILSQLLVTAAKPPSAAEANKPGKGIAEHYAAPELGSWPSISLEPGSEVRKWFFELSRERRGRSVFQHYFFLSFRSHFVFLSTLKKHFCFSISLSPPSTVRSRQLDQLRLRRLRGDFVVPHGSLSRWWPPPWSRSECSDARAGRQQRHDAPAPRFLGLWDAHRLQ